MSAKLRDIVAVILLLIHVYKTVLLLELKVAVHVLILLVEIKHRFLIDQAIQKLRIRRMIDIAEIRTIGSLSDVRRVRPNWAKASKSRCLHVKMNRQNRKEEKRQDTSKTCPELAHPLTSLLIVVSDASHAGPYVSKRHTSLQLGPYQINSIISTR
jgi:hypothetical protein